MIPPTAFEALADLRMYVTQLESLFPRSGNAYPADSIHAIVRARAAAWVDRLRAKAPATGRESLALAELALRAGDDALAQQVIDTRLQSLMATKRVGVGERSWIVERSLTLAAAVLYFANPNGTDEFAWPDSVRLAHTLPIAHAYAAQLMTLPSSRYPTRSDSTNVLYRQFGSVAELVRAETRRPHVEARAILASVDTILTMLPRFGAQERRDVFLLAVPYREIAMTLTELPDGPSRLDTLNARLLARLVPREDDLPSTFTKQQRAAIRMGIESDLRARFAVFAHLGHPAPPVRAHAWLNTADSLYIATPHSPPFNDGVIRVLVVDYGDAVVVPVLSRLQTMLAREAPGRVQFIYSTFTQGHTGPDVAQPPAEVAWLRQFYETQQRATMPIAVWAGAPIPGEFGTRTLEPSTTATDYGIAYLDRAAIVIDGHGIIRAYQGIETRANEKELIDRLRALLQEPRR